MYDSKLKKVFLQATAMTPNPLSPSKLEPYSPSRGLYDQRNKATFRTMQGQTWLTFDSTGRWIPGFQGELCYAISNLSVFY
eukprot:1363501-Amorphochlora_amoeboformis.AAC.2